MDARDPRQMYRVPNTHTHISIVLDGDVRLNCIKMCSKTATSSNNEKNETKLGAHGTTLRIPEARWVLYINRVLLMAWRPLPFWWCGCGWVDDESMCELNYRGDVADMRCVG